MSLLLEVFKAFDPDVRLGSLELDLKHGKQDLEESEEELAETGEELGELRQQRDAGQAGLFTRISALNSTYRTLLDETLRQRVKVRNLETQVFDLQCKLRKS